jgi:hypothetical protein
MPTDPEGHAWAANGLLSPVVRVSGENAQELERLPAEALAQGPCYDFDALRDDLAARGA